MANDYTDAAIVQAKVMLQDVSMSKRHNLNSFLTPQTFRFLAQRQNTKNVSKILNAGSGVCEGFKVVYQSNDQNTIGSGSGTATAACTIVPDQTFSGLNETLQIDRFFTRKMKINGQDKCSMIEFANRLAQAMADKMQELALEVNNYAISFLDTNFQTATTTGQIGTGITAGVIDYPIAYVFDPSNPQKLQAALGDMRTIIASGERLGGRPMILNGNNFANFAYLAQFNAANDDQRSQAQILAAQNMNWDVEGFLTNSISDVTFLVDPNCYAWLTANQYGETPVNRMNATNDRTWSQPLTFVNELGEMETATYFENGVRKPFMVDMRLQINCNSADAIQGIVAYDWYLEARLAASMALMPAESSKTGIVKILAA